MKLGKEKLQRLLRSKALTQESLSFKFKDKLDLEKAPNISRMFASNNDVPEKYLKGIADILDVGIEDIIIDNNPIMNSIDVLGGIVSMVGIAILLALLLLQEFCLKKIKLI